MSGQSEQVVSLVQSTLQTLPFYRSGLFCLMARRAGALNKALGAAFALRSSKLEFSTSLQIPERGPVSVRLLDGPLTWVGGLSCSRNSPVAGNSPPLLLAPVKERLSGLIVNFVHGAFFEDPAPEGTTDIGVLALCYHPRTHAASVMEEWLLRQFGELWKGRSPQLSTVVPTGCGGIVVVLARFLNDA